MRLTASRPLSFYKRYGPLRYTTTRLQAFFAVLDNLADYRLPEGELSVAFLDDAAIASVHERFLNDPSTTDVITFPGDIQMDFAGEICVSVEHARTVGVRCGNPFPRELALYLVHGWLHLAGCDDRTPEERSRMRAAERDAFVAIDAANALPDFRIVD